MESLNLVLVAVFICVGIALVVFVIELIRLMRSLRTTIDDAKTQVDPMLENIAGITKDIRPAVAKVDPLVERVQLTVDALNLEMMRVDEILEDVSQITDTASSATAAVDNITNAPVKAVNNVATKVRSVFASGKSASEESAQLVEQRAAVVQALEDYKAAQEAAPEADDAPNLDGFEKVVSDDDPGSLDPGNTGEIAPVEAAPEPAEAETAAEDQAE